jgi:hypothetical protein
MNLSLPMSCGATAVLIALACAGGAHAAPGDYAGLPVDPNVVTDSTAYTAADPVLNPNGQPGVETVFTHRDSSRKITDTILVLSDPVAASAALQAPTPGLLDGRTVPAAVGTGGTMLVGDSQDGTTSITVVKFTEGGTAAIIEFSGAVGDPVPSDLALDYARQQATAIRNAGAV